MRKISKTGPGYADHRLDQEGAGFFLPQGRPLTTQSGRFSFKSLVETRSKCGQFAEAPKLLVGHHLVEG
jgi:hypothetical protein